jgi:polyphosphate kinase 2 (PPK2 family)
MASTDHREHFIVKPGRRVRLKDIDPNDRGKHTDADSAQPLITQHLSQMSALQILLYAEQKHALLIVLQGMDAAGKDGVPPGDRRHEPVGLRGHQLQAALARGTRA